MPRFVLQQETRRWVSVVVLAAVLGSCGPWQRAGSAPHTDPAATTVPQLFDSRSVYQSMGYVVGSAPLSFVASVRFLANSVPDSTLALFAMSLPNRALSFRHSGQDFIAEYHIEVAFVADTGTVLRVTGDETVRVHNFRETLRSDESVIYQRFVLVHPGVLTVHVSVRDRNGAANAEQERVDTVPRFAGRGLGTPIAYYEGAGRRESDTLPQLVVNPRATVPYGEDSLRFYVEAYGFASGRTLEAHVLDADGTDLWHDSVAVLGDSGLATARIAIASGALPLGRGELVVQVPGTNLSVRTPLLVSLSDQWTTANFTEMLSLLRYFDRQDLLAKLRTAPPEERATLWHEFYRATDPTPVTRENEALDEYFHRLGIANAEYREPGIAGWLTERGEVYITLGEPDEIFDLSNEVTTTQAHTIRWQYLKLRLTVYFQDQTGFGQFRLTPSSRAEYQRILAQLRGAQAR